MKPSASYSARTDKVAFHQVSTLACFLTPAPEPGSRLVWVPCSKGAGPRIRPGVTMLGLGDVDWQWRSVGRSPTGDEEAVEAACVGEHSGVGAEPSVGARREAGGKLVRLDRHGH